MNKHSPGPWEVDYRPHTNRFHVVQPGEGTATQDPEICEMNWFNGRHEQVKANAYLVAAAPDLLEALEMMITLYEEVQPAGGWQGYYDNAKYCIKKAKGEQP